jgi:hypothetical protein
VSSEDTEHEDVVTDLQVLLLKIIFTFIIILNDMLNDIENYFSCLQKYTGSPNIKLNSKVERESDIQKCSSEASNYEVCKCM